MREPSQSSPLWRLGSLSSTAAIAGDVRIMWYSDGVEGQVLQDLLTRFMQKNPGINVILDNVVLQRRSRSSCRSSSRPASGPDIARVTNLKAQAQHWLDLRPLLPDADYWDKNFGTQADWMRPDGSNAITGFMTQLTLTGGFANKTLFDQAGVALPGKDATWDDWAAAARQVAQKPAGAVRHGAGPIRPPSHRAEYLLRRQLHRPDGKPAPLDDGSKDIHHQVRRLDRRRHDDEGRLGLGRGLDLPCRVRGLHQRPARLLLLGLVAGRPTSPRKSATPSIGWPPAAPADRRPAAACPAERGWSRSSTPRIRKT